MHHVTPASARVYGRFLGKRYARFPNLMWMQVGDRNPDERLMECTGQLARSTREAPLLWKLLEPHPWWKLVPDLDGKPVTAGGGTWGKADHVAAALAEDGSFALAYLPGHRSVTVDLSRLEGRVSARWYDPTDGSVSEAEGSRFPPGGTRQFTPPERNQAGEPDYALVLEEER